MDGSQFLKHMSLKSDKNLYCKGVIENGR